MAAPGMQMHSAELTDLSGALLCQVLQVSLNDISIAWMNLSLTLPTACILCAFVARRPPTFMALTLKCSVMAFSLPLYMQAYELLRVDLPAEEAVLAAAAPLGLLEHARARRAQRLKQTDVRHTSLSRLQPLGNADLGPSRYKSRGNCAVLQVLIPEALTGKGVLVNWHCELRHAEALRAI